MICSVPGCPAAVKRGKCGEHRSQHEHERGSSTQRGYGSAHQQLRADYQRRMDRGETFTCWRCLDPIDPNAWQLGHDDHDRSVYRGPECVPCNTATSGR